MKTEQIGFRTTPEIRKGIEDLAREAERTISVVINRILAAHLTKETQHGVTHANRTT